MSLDAKDEKVFFSKAEPSRQPELGLKLNSILPPVSNYSAPYRTTLQHGCLILTTTQERNQRTSQGEYYIKAVQSAPSLFSVHKWS